MSDPLSILASIITVIEAVKHTATTASRLLHAPKTYNALIIDLDELRRSATPLQRHPKQLTDVNALIRALALVEDIHKAVVQALAQRSLSTRARAVYLMRHASKMEYYRKQIRAMQKSLLFATSASTLSVFSHRHTHTASMPRLANQTSSLMQSHANEQLAHVSRAVNRQAETLSTVSTAVSRSEMVNNSPRNLLVKVLQAKTVEEQHAVVSNPIEWVTAATHGMDGSLVKAASSLFR